MDNKDIDIILARAEDLADRVLKRGLILYTDFYNPYESEKVEELLRGNKHIDYIKTGGHPEAERTLFILFPVFDQHSDTDFIKVVNITWSYKHYKIDHRDILGSLIGLGLKREKFGDILVGEGEAFVFCHSNIADFINNSLIKAGRAPVTVNVFNVEDAVLPEIKTKIINTTVASPRLDTILSACFRLSRTKIMPYIKSGRVIVNGITIDKASYMVCEGDILSVRGIGKGKVISFGSKTKRDRLSICLARYI